MNESNLLGGASIFCWLFAQSPQIYENWRRGSCDGIALPFLALWFAGDATNLLGCVLTDQLVFQTALALYFVIVDVVLGAQWAYYARVNPPRSHKHYRGRYRDASILPPSHEHTQAHVAWMHRSLPPSGLQSAFGTTPDLVTAHHTEARAHGRTPSLDNAPRHAMAQSLDRGRLIVAEAALRASRSPSMPRRTGSVLLLGVFAFVGIRSLGDYGDVLVDGTSAAWLEQAPKPPIQIDWQRLIGRMASWTCATLYLSSRLPQVWKNYRRKSVEGLSALLFMAAFMGNLLYSLSIFSSPVLQTDPTFLPESIPYLLGSGGTLCFDLTIMSQIVIYRRRRARKLLSRRQRNADRQRGSEHEVEPLAHSMSEESEGDELMRPGRSRSVKRVPTIAEENSSTPGTPIP